MVNPLHLANLSRPSSCIGPTTTGSTAKTTDGSATAVTKARTRLQARSWVRMIGLSFHKLMVGKTNSVRKLDHKEFAGQFQDEGSRPVGLRPGRAGWHWSRPDRHSREGGNEPLWLLC